MKRVSTMFNCLLLAGMILLSFTSAFAEGNGFFESQVVNRDKRVVMAGLGRHTYDYPAYIISNIPQYKMMKQICRDALLRTDRDGAHCKYISLQDVGTFKKKQLLPYTWNKDDIMTVIVIDRSTLTDADRDLLAKLVFEVFPLTPADAKPNEIIISAQCRGGKIMQVIVDMPDSKWLQETADDLWSLPKNFVVDDTRSSNNVTRVVSKTAMITNNDLMRTDVARYLSSYCDLEVYNLGSLEEFRNAAGFDRRIIALDWNGADEISPAMSAKVLPVEYREQCADQRLNRIGLTGWQRFCREANAKRCDVNGVETWVMTAPTVDYLRQLGKLVAAAKFTGGPIDIKICDLTHINSIAVGVYVASKEANRNSLVLQQQLEEHASKSLRSKVSSMVTVDNWSTILEGVMGDNPTANDPFGRGSNVVRINQASKTDAVLLLWVKQIQPEVTYSIQKRRDTPSFPAFEESEPSKPSEPRPGEMALNGFKGMQHKYPGDNDNERRNSSAFMRDWNKWKYTDFPNYESKHSEWTKKKEKWTYDRSRYEVNYIFDLNATPKVAMSSYVKIIDQVATQSVLWTHDVDLAKNGGSHNIRQYSRSVSGEDTDCAQPEFGRDYQNTRTWRDCEAAIGADELYRIGQNLMVDSLDQALLRLSREALWANDLKPWSLPSNVGQRRE